MLLKIVNNNVAMFKKKKSTGKVFPVKVSTMDAELEFSLNIKATGQELFDLVTRTIGLRETWYFGVVRRNLNDLKYDKFS